MENTGRLLVTLSDDTLYFLLIWSWQAALLLSAVWFTLKLDRSRTAVVRHRIWVLGLIGIVILPLGAAAGELVPLPLPGPLNYVAEIPAAITSAVSPPRSATGRAPAEPAVDNGEPASARQRSVKWASVVRSTLFLAWIAGSMTALCRFSVFSWKLRRVCGKARRVSMAELDCAERDWSVPSRQATIGLSSDVQSPQLAGLVRPMILLPADITSWTSAEERTAIIRHEWMHLGRRDHYVNLFQVLLNAIFFFHPLVRYASSRLNVERELACDEGVLNLGTGAAVYAESIMKVAERNTLPDAVHQPAAFASRRTLERRIEMITGTVHSEAIPRRWPFLVLPIAVITLVIWVLQAGQPVTGGGAQARESKAGDEQQANRASQQFEPGMRDFSSAGSMPAAGEIFDRYVDALGGRPAIEKISSRVVSGTMEGEDLQGARSGSFQEYTEAPNKYLMVKEPSSWGTLKVGFNGVVGWRWSEYWGFGGEWDDYDGGLAKQRADFYRDVRLKTLYPKMAVIGKGGMRDREVFVLEGSPEEGIVDRMYFDAQTGLLLRLNHSIQGWKHVFVDYFDDYREVDGVRIPFIRRRTSPDRYVVKVSEVRQNIPIESSEFDAPGNNMTQGLRRLFYGKLHLRNPFRRNAR